MRIQPHMLPSRIVVDIIGPRTHEFGIDFWGEARLALDSAAGNRLKELAKGSSHNLLCVRNDSRAAYHDGQWCATRGTA